MQRPDSLEKTLMLGRLRARGKGGDRGWNGWMASPTDSMDKSLSKLREKDREAWRAAVHGVTENWTRLSEWTTILSGRKDTTVSALLVSLEKNIQAHVWTERKISSKNCFYVSSDEFMSFPFFQSSLLLSYCCCETINGWIQMSINAWWHKQTENIYNGLSLSHQQEKRTDIWHLS